jgi:hypothetical protein
VVRDRSRHCAEDAQRRQRHEVGGELKKDRAARDHP